MKITAPLRFLARTLQTCRPTMSCPGGPSTSAIQQAWSKMQCLRRLLLSCELGPHARGSNAKVHAVASTTSRQILVTLLHMWGKMVVGTRVSAPLPADSCDASIQELPARVASTNFRVASPIP